MQHVIVAYSFQFAQAFAFGRYYRRCGINYVQFFVAVIAFHKSLGPVGLLENLVDKQHSASVAHELAGKVNDSPALEVEVVHVDVETLLQLRVEVVAGVL